MIEYPHQASNPGTKEGMCLLLILERLVHTQHKQKALYAYKPLKSLEHESGLLRKDHGTSQAAHTRSWEYNLKLFLSVQLFAKSQLCVIVSEGNCLPDGILL